MRKEIGLIIKRCLVVWIAILMLGILGSLNNISDTDVAVGLETTSGNSGNDIDISSTRSAGGSRGTVIGGYLELWDYSLNEPHDGTYGDGDGTYYYLGTTNQYFRIYLKSTYEGQVLRYVNTTLIRGSELSDVFTITNGEDYEYNMFKNDLDSFYFYMDIHNSAQIKIYQFSLRVEIYAIDSNGQGRSLTETMTLKLQLSSRIRSTESTYKSLKVHAVNKGGSVIPLYSGAKNQIIGLHHIQSTSGILTDLEFSITPPSDFVLDSKIAKLDSVDTNYNYNTDPLWKLLSTGSNYEKPKEYYGSGSVLYKLYGKSINEKSITIRFEIDITPIITYREQISESDIGSISNSKMLSNFEIYQGSTSKLLTLNFKNTGNIDLKDVEVELYTDDASYFFKSQYYYDESSHAYKRSYFKSVFFGAIFMDETVSGSFPIEIVKDLPPGLYRIPMKYKIKYEIEGFTDIEVEVDDYHEAIIAARSDDNKGYQPFVLINVKEGDDPSDINEPDLFAFSETPLSVGDRNVLLTVELSNLERYQISNVIPELQVGGESPLQKLNSRDPLESWLEPLEKDFILFSANDPTNSNTFELHYMLDVSNNIMPGMYTVPIMVSCLDCMNNQRFNTVYLQLNIQPNPPKFLVSEIYASTVKPNEDFNLTLTVFNSGGSDARNVTLMFNGSSNLFSAVSSIKGPEHIKKSEQENFVFKLQASDLEPGSKHTLSFFVTCEDCLGNIQTYDKNPELSIPIMVKKFNPSFAPRFIISETTTTSIKPNSDFTLRVKLLNCGGSTAQNVKVMFNGSSNLFLAEDRMKSLPSISRNQEGLFEFNIKAGEVEPGKVYDSSVHVSFEDTEGKLYSFDTNAEQAISLRTKEPKPQEWQISEGFALIVLGFLILISALIIGVLRARTGKRGSKSSEVIEAEQIKAVPGRVQSPQGTMTSTESGKKKGHGLFGKKKENVDYRPSIGTSTPEPGPAVTTPMPQQSRQGQWGYQQQQQYQPAPANYQNTTPVEYLPPGQGYNPYQSQKQQEQYY